MEIEKNAKKIVETLIKNNYEAYVVGGCVRDSIMGITPKDWDITTSATPFEVKKIFPKTFDTGIEHGTVTVVMEKNNYEVTTYRIDGKYEDNRRPTEVAFTKNIKEDLLRRDFTINAIAYNHIDGYVDFFNGIEDIENKIIRGVGDPIKRFEEDGLRMLRAIRFSGTTGFDIDKETYEAIVARNYLLKNISVERIREELTKLLKSPNPNKLRLLVDTRLIFYYDTWFYQYLEKNINNICTLLNKVPKDNFYVYSILFYKTDEKTCFNQMKNLKWDNKTITNVSKIVAGIQENLSVDLYSIRKFVSKYGIDNSEIIFNLKEILGESNVERFKIELENIKINKFPLTIKELDIDGNILKSKGITDGKKIGFILNSMLDLVLKNPENNNQKILLNSISKEATNA